MTNSQRMIEIKKCIENSVEIVNDIRDESFRKIAFGTILNYLLGSLYPDKKEDEKTKQNIKLIEESKKTKKTSGIKVWMQELIDEDFFKEPRTLNDVVKRLEKSAHRLKSTHLQPYLIMFMNEKQLRRDKLKVKETKKSAWHYFNW